MLLLFYFIPFSLFFFILFLGMNASPEVLANTPLPRYNVKDGITVWTAEDCDELEKRCKANPSDKAAKDFKDFLFSTINIFRREEQTSAGHRRRPHLRQQATREVFQQRTGATKIVHFVLSKSRHGYFKNRGEKIIYFASQDEYTGRGGTAGGAGFFCRRHVSAKRVWETVICKSVGGRGPHGTPRSVSPSTGRAKSFYSFWPNIII
ncbi:hypothetical protein AGDE_11590 [Angomonas deanei]|nr:hypothetical protein AGDE_11590 [Angomonas deanei]|eukprot:EPY26001.1 hypothetical protein AGDE_11590 [Angomonas deanei]